MNAEAEISTEVPTAIAVLPGVSCSWGAATFTKLVKLKALPHVPTNLRSLAAVLGQLNAALLSVTAALPNTFVPLSNEHVLAKP
jgi:hypothetical protein